MDPDQKRRMAQTFKHYVEVSSVGQNLTEPAKKEIKDKGMNKMLKECCGDAVAKASEAQVFPRLCDRKTWAIRGGGEHSPADMRGEREHVLILKKISATSDCVDIYSVGLFTVIFVCFGIFFCCCCFLGVLIFFYLLFLLIVVLLIFTFVFLLLCFVVVVVVLLLFFFCFFFLEVICRNLF